MTDSYFRGAETMATPTANNATVMIEKISLMSLPK